MKIPVYGQVFDQITVDSSISSKRKYSIRLGEVRWNDEAGKAIAVYIVVEYDGIPQMYERPVIPHFLVELDKSGESDLSKILKGLNEIRKRNNL